MISFDGSNLADIGRLGLRPVRDAEDQDLLFRLYCETRDDLADLPMDADAKTALLKMQFDAQRMSYGAEYPDAEHFIVTVGEQDVGQLKIEYSDSTLLGIDLSIHTKLRDKGIGSAVLNGLFREAVATDRAFVLHVLKTNPAINLYERLGCRITADKGSHFEMKWKGASGGDLNVGQ